MALVIKARLEVEVSGSVDAWTRKYPSPQVPAPGDLLALWHDEELANIVVLTVERRFWNSRGDEVVLLLSPLRVLGRRVYLDRDPLLPGRSDYESFMRLLSKGGWNLTEG